MKWPILTFTFRCYRVGGFTQNIQTLFHEMSLAVFVATLHIRVQSCVTTFGRYGFGFFTGSQSGIQVCPAMSGIPSNGIELEQIGIQHEEI